MPADLTKLLGDLRQTAGSPSFAEVAKRVAELRRSQGRPESECWVARSTVYDAFRADRRRISEALLSDLVGVLGGTDAELAEALAAARSLRNDSSPVATVHDSLPGPEGTFVGRIDELTALADLATVPAVVAITGLGGIGKTQLALQAAHRIVARGLVAKAFHLDLRGFDAALAPVHPDAARLALLGELGVKSPPRDRAQQAAVLEERLGQGTTLIVLDDAADAAQVVPLIPATHQCIYLVTSRVPLDGLDNHSAFPLGPLAPAEAMALFDEAVGPDRAATDPKAASELVALADGHALALSLLANRVAAQPDWSLADHRDQIAARLGQLRLDGALSATLTTTYERLSLPAQALLRMLAAQPCADLDVEALAALGGFDDTEARTVASELATHHLVQFNDHGRCSLHPVVRAHALETSYDIDPPSARDAAANRLLDHFVASAWGASEEINVGRQMREDLNPEITPRHFRDGARGWVEHNIDAVLTLVGQLAEARPLSVINLATTLTKWLDYSARYRDGLWLNELAIEAATTHDDERSAAWARIAGGKALIRVGRYDEALGFLESAYDVLSRLGERLGRRSTLNGLGIIDLRAGRLEAALARFQEMAQLAAEDGEDGETSVGLANASICLRRLGLLDEAAEHIRGARVAAERIDDPLSLSGALLNEADIAIERGEYDEALSLIDRGQPIAEQAASRLSVGYALVFRSICATKLGAPADAVKPALEALEMSGEVGDQHLHVRARISLGEAHHAIGNLDEARTELSAARQMADEIGNPAIGADALSLLAEVDLHAGRPEHAARHWSDAVILYDQVRSPRAAVLRERLDLLLASRTGGRAGP